MKILQTKKATLSAGKMIGLFIKDKDKSLFFEPSFDYRECINWDRDYNNYSNRRKFHWCQFDIMEFTTVWNGTRNIPGSSSSSWLQDEGVMI